MGRVIALLLALGVFIGGAQAFFFLAAAPGRSEDVVVFEVPPGRSFGAVARELEALGLITNAFKLRILARITGQGSQIKVGEYSLNKGLTPLQVLNILVSGKSVLYSLTFPEGSNIYQMAEIIEKSGRYKAADFLRLAKDTNFVHEVTGVEQAFTLEGYLFPETYSVTKFTPLKELLTKMVASSKAHYQNLAQKADGNLPSTNLTPHEIMILASMVEKETGAGEERPRIASVFYNRLAKNMRLQSDPTTIYGIWVMTGQERKNITREDLLRPTPYNTYTLPRLPMGPIANPGAEAINAVLNPEKSDYLYFVSHNDGTHAFSKTYEEHQKAVQMFQLDSTAREGKSWRDLSKSKK